MIGRATGDQLPAIGAEAEQGRLDPGVGLPQDGALGERHQDQRTILATGDAGQQGRGMRVHMAALVAREVEGLGRSGQGDGPSGLERGERHSDQRRGVAIEHPEGIAGRGNLHIGRGITGTGAPADGQRDGVDFVDRASLRATST